MKVFMLLKQIHISSEDFMMRILISLMKRLKTRRSFLEFIEEGYDIDEIENIICEAIDTELEVLNEVTSPAKVAALRMKKQVYCCWGRSWR